MVGPAIRGEAGGPGHLAGVNVDRRGLWLGVGAYVAWGFSPLYWKALDHVSSFEVFAHRAAWSVPLLIAAVVVRGRLGVLREVLRDRRALGWGVVAGSLIGANWVLFVWGVNSGHVVDVSLGYFINPLVSVALGMVFLGERLSSRQRVAVAVAVVGVVVIAVTNGRPPWIALGLAGFFGFYGLVKKQPGAAGPLEGLLLDSTVAGLPAAAWIAASVGSGGSALGRDASTAVLLVGAGLVTAVPLLMFGGAVQRIPLASVGILQYVTPTMQFLLGVVVFGEAVTRGQLVGFGFVWLALALYTADVRGTDRSRVRTAAAG